MSITTRTWWKSLSVALAVAAIAGALVVELTLGRMSGELPEFLRFAGRMHPLVVHLPTGLFVLVAAAELTGFLVPRLRDRIDAALGLVLPFMVLSMIGAFAIGHLLAHEGGFPSRGLAMHRRLTLVALIGGSMCVIAWAYAEHAGSRLSRGIYRGVLVLSFSVLSIGAHFGGTLTRGDAYLAKYAPAPFRGLLGGGTPPQPAGSPPPAASAAAEPLVFADGVAPVLKEHCLECHGGEKTKGELRLDTLENLKRGGESGAAIVPGVPGESPIVKRMRLPVTDDDRMPPEGRPGPTPEQIALIEFWITRGASDTLRVRDTLAPPSARGLLESIASSRAAAPPAQTRIPAASSAPAPATAAEAASAEPVRGGEAEPAGGSAEEASSDAGSRGASAGAPGARTSALDILSEKCGKCHGASKQKGKLRLDSLEGVLRGGSHGEVVVPGDPDRSAIIKRARLPLESKDHMPPKKEPQLTSGELAALIAWVRSQPAGAPQAADAEPDAPRRSEPPRQDHETRVARSGAPATLAPEAEQPTTAPRDEVAPAEPARTRAGAANAGGLVRLFAEAVGPMLTDKCAGCHGGSMPQANLRMDSHEALRKGGDSGPAIVPGVLEESLIYTRATLPPSDPDHMPPDGEPQPSAGELELLRVWIAKGAAADTTVGLEELSPEARATLSARRAPATAAEPVPRPGPAQAAVIPAHHGGCAGCVVAESSSSTLPEAALAALAGIALAARRRRWTKPPRPIRSPGSRADRSPIRDRCT